MLRIYKVWIVHLSILLIVHTILGFYIKDFIFVAFMFIFLGFIMTIAFYPWINEAEKKQQKLEKKKSPLTNFSNIRVKLSGDERRYYEDGRVWRSS